MKETLFAAGIAVLVLAMFVHQEGIRSCPDGRRYCSGKPQPKPFHRRFCSWPAKLLTPLTWLSLLFVAVSFGTWWQSLLFITLPGVALVATRPTCVDGPTMALAWGSSLLWPTHPVLAVALSCLSGAVHERGPVFAALYCWSPWPLLGLAAVQWWRKPARWDGDPYVDISGLSNIIRQHRPWHDFLDWRGWVLPTRAVIPLAAMSSAPMSAWTALLVASATRLVGTENGRFLAYGAIPLIAATHADPLPTFALYGAVAMHAQTLSRLP